MKAVVAAALVNFLWQGVAIGALAWIGFAVARTPRVRYLVGVLALAIMAIAPVVTGFGFVGAGDVPRPSSNVQGPLPSQVLGASSGDVDPRRGTADGSGPVTPDGGARWTLDDGRWTVAMPSLTEPRVASLVFAVWLLGVATLSLRLTLGWLGVRRLTRRVTDAGATVQAIAHRLMVALNIRARVRIVESALVKVPAVVGAFKPVVLLPAAAMSGLSMEQVEALLAHELAHVRRHDYLVNLLQSAVETLLFYHPAVWLVSRRVRQERELCCDDLALGVCGDRVAYASALADLESRRAIPSPALAATGGSLLARIRRILGADEGAPVTSRGRSIAGLVILASIVLLIATQAARARSVPTIEELASSIGPLGMEVFEAQPAPKQPGGRAEQSPAPPQVQPSGRAERSPTPPQVQGAPGGVSEGVPAAERQTEVPPEAPQTAGPPIAVGQIVRLEVTVGQVRQAEFNKDYTVQPDGTILVPYLGVVKAAGQTTRELGTQLAGSLNASGTLPGAKVAVAIEIRMPPPPPPAPLKVVTVTVQGAIRNPGRIRLREDGATLTDAIAGAGGLQATAGARIFLRRTGAPDVTYSKATLLDGRLADAALKDGDIIVVEVAPRFYVTGYVKNSTSEYNWEEGMTLQKALAMAGGVSDQGAANRIAISRKDPKTGKFTDVKIDKDRMATPIQPDDVIKVPAKRM